MWPEGVPDSAAVQEILYFQVEAFSISLSNWSPKSLSTEGGVPSIHVFLLLSSWNVTMAY
jgi:hypothetical protein